MDHHFSLVAGCLSRDRVINAQTAARWGVRPDRVYATSDDFIKAECTRLDAVVTLLPIPDHFDIVVTCLSAGLAVICEKALLVDTNQSAKQIDEWLTQHALSHLTGNRQILRSRRRVTFVHGEFGNQRIEITPDKYSLIFEFLI